MACTDCGGSCSCVVIAGRGARITGSGGSTDPYVVETLGPVSPDWQAASTRAWGTSGTVTLADVLEPETLEVTLTGNVSTITLPSWLSTVSGIITLIITNPADYTVVFPGMTAGGLAVGVTEEGVTLVHLLWTGVRWITLLGAGDLQ